MKTCSVCRRCHDDSVISCGECYAPLSETYDGSPDMIAGYHLDLLLESGVRGRLFRARRIECGQLCSIKIVSADESGSRRFLDEARIAATFFHPNLADVYEFGSLETGEVFVVAEEPEGRTLREVLDADGTPSLLTTIEIARQVSETVHAIHLKGLTHRALNPKNIVVTTDHENQLLVRIKNLDLGGVVEHSIISNKFLIDSALDSIRYFAPEQCSGDDASVQTDVYSLGIVLYEMLAGVPPFDAAKATGLIEKHRNQQPPDVRIANFELRMLLTHTLTESLQKKPQLRQRSADNFARQIRHIEQLATHVSTPPPAGAVSLDADRPASRANVAAASAVPYVSPINYKPAPKQVEIETITESSFTFDAETAESEAESAVVESIESPVESMEHETASSEFDVSPEAPDVEDLSISEPQPIDQASEAPAVSETKFWLRRQVSRLKVHRKRLHAKIAQMIYEPRIVETHSNVIEAFTESVSVQPVEISARKPTHIEWNQPEDDIPSVADVMKILSEEQQVQAEPVQMESLSSEVEAAADMEIEMETEPVAAVNVQAEPVQMESLTSEVEAAGGEPAAGIEMETEAVAAVTVFQTTHADEDRLEDDIPFVAVPVDVLSKEQGVPTEYIPTESQDSVAEVVRVESSVEMEPKQFAAIRVRKPTFIEFAEFAQTDDTTPPAAIDWGRLLESVPADRFALKNEAPAILPKPQTPQIPIFQSETEEITLVRPPIMSRFTVQLQSPAAGRVNAPPAKFSQRKRADSGFFPTLLDNRAKTKLSDADSKDVMFSAFYDKPRRFPGRLMLSGIVGLTAVAAGFLFGDDLVTKYLQASGPGTEAAITKPSPAEVDKVVAPSRKRNARNSKKTLSEKSVDDSRTLGVGKNSKDDDPALPEIRKRQSASDKKTPVSEPTRPRVVKDSKR